jgi:protein TonB
VSEIDLAFRPETPPRDRPAGPARLAIAGAVLLHAGIALWLLGNWHRSPALEPPVIVATLVQEPPPAPPPPRKPDKPQQPDFAERSSGPGEKTTAPPPAKELAPEPEAPPPAAAAAEGPPDQPPEPAPAPATAPPEPQPKPQAPPRAEPKKQQFALRAPKLTPPHEDRAFGEKEEMGDPYLNMMYARVEQNRAPTTPIGPSGLHLEGISVFELMLSRTGRMEEIVLERSSGAPQLDAEARRMIVAATPFPPLPSDYPDHAVIKVTIHLEPR